MSETCATCSHWTDLTAEYAVGCRLPLGDVPSSGRWGWCTKVDEISPSSGSSQFYVIDGDDYRASLHTRETFGCTEHETGENSE